MSRNLERQPLTAGRTPRPGLLGVQLIELMVGPDKALGQQIGDRDGSDAVADDDLEGRKVLKKNLPTPSARRNHPPIPVPHGNHRVQLVDALSGRRTDDDHLGAGSSREVVGVHSRDDPAVPGAGRGRHGVVLAPAASARDVRCGLDEFVVDRVDTAGLHSHLLCFSAFVGYQATLTRVTMASKRISPERPLHQLL